jgi:Ca2+-binding EF-hand superfamily protein
MRGDGIVTAESSSHEQKIAGLFDLLDNDHDGVLTEEDSTKIFEEMVRQFGRDPDSPQARKCQRVRDQFWQSMLAAVDKDNDGRITRDEYIAYHNDLSLEDIKEGTILYADAIFELADSDDNNKISKEEFTRQQHAKGETSPDFVDDVFRRFDGDGDGVLTKAEFIEYVVDFMRR